MISSVIVVSAKTFSRPSSAPGWPFFFASSCCSETIFCCMVRMSSRPVRSPTWARRGYSWPPKLRWLIRPSAVRSNSAPYVSSSQTRCGASSACSSAIRGLLRNLPPRMVSRKCTCQLSLALELPIAAAMPPSAMTVWALPNSDLQTMAVRRPCSRASMAARRPAPPAPMTTTSYAWRSSSVTAGLSVDQAQVGQCAGGDQRDVEVGDDEGGEGRPSELHVVAVQPRDPLPQPVSHRVPGEVVDPPGRDVPARVAGQRVGPEQDDVAHQDEVAEPEAEPARAAVERHHRVVGGDERDQDGRVEEVRGRVLQQQREPRLAGVPRVRLRDRAGGRGQPERAGVGLAVVVAGEPDGQQERQREDRERDQRREVPERRPEVAGPGGAGGGQAR